MVKERKEKAGSRSEEKTNTDMVKAVMFVPHTHNSALAKNLREIENNLGGMTGSKIKIVEKSGVKLEDILTSSNPWKGQLCNRLDCLLCTTKLKTDKNNKQDCSKRNLVYETHCATCETRERKRIEAEIEGKAEREKRIKEIKQFKYIGETSRSVYERSREHVSDMEQLKPSSHLLKHIVDKHEKENPGEIEFGLRVLKYTRSSFERQILESVIIQQERHHFLLNS